MENAVTLTPDHIINIEYEGDQSGQTAKQLHEQVLALAQPVREKHLPVFILADVLKLGNSDTASHMATIDALKELQFEKLAVLGANPYIVHIASFIMSAAGKANLIKHVQTKEEATAWFAQGSTGEKLTLPTKKILVVDSDGGAVTGYRRMFASDPFEIYAAHTVASAKTILTAEKPDLLILDLTLSGGENGLDLIEDMNNDPQTATIPVLVCTDLQGQEQTLTRLGVATYLLKQQTTETEIISKAKLLMHA